MNVTRSLYFIATIVEVAKSCTEADDVSVLAKAQSLFESTYFFRGSGSNDEKETGKKNEEMSIINESPRRMLEVGTKRLLQLISIDINIGYCEEEYERIFVASDGSRDDRFGSSCSMSNNLVVIGAPDVESNNIGAAYLFHLNGTEVAKLTPGDDGGINDYFSDSVSIDEKVVVGSYGNYFRVFSRYGIYERTIRCDDCYYLGYSVATLGNLIVTSGQQNVIEKLFIYTTEGQLLNSLEQGSNDIWDVAISEQFIVSTGTPKTIIYSNTYPDFPKITEINQEGDTVAVSGDRIVIGKDWIDGPGGAWLYKTDGTLVTALDRPDYLLFTYFGSSVAITDDKIFVGDWGGDSSVFIYSAIDGEFVEKVVAPDDAILGLSVCVSGSYYVVGDEFVDNYAGAAYLFQLP